jgi:hypothetical protein
MLQIDVVTLEPYQHMGRLSRELACICDTGFLCVLHDLHFLGKRRRIPSHALTCSLRSFSASVNLQDVSFLWHRLDLLAKRTEHSRMPLHCLVDYHRRSIHVTPNQVVDTSIRRVFIGLQVCFVVMSFRHVKHSEVLKVRMHVGVQNCTRSVHIYERFI